MDVMLVEEEMNNYKYGNSSKGVPSFFYGEPLEYNSTFTITEKNIINDILNKVVNYVDVMNFKEVNSSMNELFTICKDEKIQPAFIKKSLCKMIDLCRIKIDDFDKACAQNDFASSIDIKEYIMCMVDFKKSIKMISKWFESVIKEMKTIKDGRGDRVIEYAKEYIKENYKNNISLTDVADKVYLNANYLSEVFKKKVGKKFIDYLVELRIEESKRLLKKPGIKIYEVANEVGYKEHVSFNRAFKRIVGMSPKEYMKLVK